MVKDQKRIGHTGEAVTYGDVFKVVNMRPAGGTMARRSSHTDFQNRSRGSLKALLTADSGPIAYSTAYGCLSRMQPWVTYSLLTGQDGAKPFL